MSAGILISSNTLTLRVLTLGHSGEYSCEATNFVGQGRSQPILIHMKCKYSYGINKTDKKNKEGSLKKAKLKSLLFDDVQMLQDVERVMRGEK